MKKWFQQKTTWAGLAGLLTAVGGAATGQIDTSTAIQLGLTSLIGIFLRQGVENLKKGE